MSTEVVETFTDLKIRHAELESIVREFLQAEDAVEKSEGRQEICWTEARSAAVAALRSWVSQ